MAVDVEKQGLTALALQPWVLKSFARCCRLKCQVAQHWAVLAALDFGQSVLLAHGPGQPMESPQLESSCKLDAELKAYGVGRLEDLEPQEPLLVTCRLQLDA